jgi:hypothetical protein
MILRTRLISLDVVKDYIEKRRDEDASNAPINRKLAGLNLAIMENLGSCGRFRENFGGEGGIRTPVTLPGKLDFESSAFNRARPPLQ